MTREQIHEFFRQQETHWRRRNAAALADGHAGGGTLVSPIFGTITGWDGIAASYRRLFDVFPDWDLLASDVIVEGERVAQRFKVTATHAGEFMGLPGTGKRFTIEGVRLFTMKDGKIQHEQRFYDFTGLLIQVGVLKGKPAH